MSFQRLISDSMRLTAQTELKTVTGAARRVAAHDLFQGEELRAVFEMHAVEMIPVPAPATLMDPGR